MYTPPAFRDEDTPSIHAMIHATLLAQFVTATASGPLATPVPMLLAEDEGEFGTLYAHVAKANPQWREPPIGPALAIFMGPDAYITPSWYASKQEHGKVVPTWNYEAVQAFGPAEFFEDPARLLDAVTRLTNRHERPRAAPWAVDDAPEPFVAGQLKGIVGIRMPITRLEGKRKMSQNRPQADRAGVVRGLLETGNEHVASLIPE